MQKQKRWRKAPIERKFVSELRSHKFSEGKSLYLGLLQSSDQSVMGSQTASSVSININNVERNPADGVGAFGSSRHRFVRLSTPSVLSLLSTPQLSPVFSPIQPVITVLFKQESADTTGYMNHITQTNLIVRSFTVEDPLSFLTCSCCIFCVVFYCSTDQCRCKAEQVYHPPHSFVCALIFHHGTQKCITISFKYCSASFVEICYLTGVAY